MSTTHRVSHCFVCAIAALPGLAVAQTNTLSALEEIVVTAQRRSENLQDVAVAVTALTSETRELLGIKSVQDMTDFTPSLVYYNGLDRMTLRGVGRLTNNAGTDPGIATYVDGFYLTSNILVGVSSLFNERVEILRGPQGTLYGRNAVGGAINTISRRPTDAWTGEVRATAGNFDRHGVEGTVSGPIAGSWKFRVTASDQQQDEGYYDNIGKAPSEGNTQDDQTYDVQLQGEVGPLDVWVKYFTYEYDRTSRILNTGVPYNTTTFFPGTNLIPAAAFQYNVTNPAIADPRTINTDTPARFTLDNADMWVTHLTTHLGAMDVNYIGGYYAYDLHLTNDADNISRDPFTYQPPSGAAVTIGARNVFLYEEFHKYNTHELNLTSTGNGPLQWIFGAYYIDEDLWLPFRLMSPDQAQLRQPGYTLNSFAPPFPITLNGGGAPNPEAAYVYQAGMLNTKSTAAFGQFDWSFAEAWKLTVGLRYSEDKKVGTAYQRYVSWNPSIGPAFGANVAVDVTPAVTGFPAGTTPAIMDVERSSDGFSGTLGIDWHPKDNLLAYAKYSRGIKAASLNLGQVSFTNPRSTTVGPEQLDALEVGMKQQVGNLQLNGAVYLYDYTDAQVPVNVRGAGNLVIANFINLEKMRNYGLEIEAIWQPVEALALSLNYSYLHTRIEKSQCFVDVVDPLALQPGATPCPGGATPTAVVQSPVGSHMLGSPENKISATASYTFDFASGALTFTLIDSWRDEQFSFILDRPYWQTPSYNLLNARVTWTGNDGRYNVIGFVNNLTDELATDAVGASTTSTGINQAFGYLAPRTYGLELQYRFGGALR